MDVPFGKMNWMVSGESSQKRPSGAALKLLSDGSGVFAVTRPVVLGNYFDHGG
jgi:hypothetical protein